MNRVLSIAACFTLLASPAALAQGKPPGAGQGKPPASAPKPNQAPDPDSKGNGQGKGNPNEQQQELQKHCQDQAHERGLKGDEHQHFMQQCMGNVPDSKGPGGKPGQNSGR